MPYHEVPQGLHVLTLSSRVCSAPTDGALTSDVITTTSISAINEPFSALVVLSINIKTLVAVAPAKIF